MPDSYRLKGVQIWHPKLLRYSPHNSKRRDKLVTREFTNEILFSDLIVNSPVDPIFMAFDITLEGI